MKRLSALLFFLTVGCEATPPQKAQTATKVQPIAETKDEPKKAESKKAEPIKAERPEPKQMALKFLIAFPEKYTNMQLKTMGYAFRIPADRANKRRVLLSDHQEFILETIVKSIVVEFQEDLPDSLIGDQIEVVGLFDIQKLTPTAQRPMPFLTNAKLCIP